VLLFHHDPSRTDPEVTSILEAARALAAGSGVAVDLGRDRSTFVIGDEQAFTTH